MKKYWCNNKAEALDALRREGFDGKIAEGETCPYGIVINGNKCHLIRDRELFNAVDAEGEPELTVENFIEFANDVFEAADIAATCYQEEGWVVFDFDCATLCFMLDWEKRSFDVPEYHSKATDCRSLFNECMVAIGVYLQSKAERLRRLIYVD